MHAVVLAGGKGTRLRPYTTALPKPLVPLGDQHVILDVVLQQLARQGFTSVTLAINHLGRLIRAFVGDGSAWGLQVTFVEETTPLSTCGPLFTMPHLPEHFVVMNGDVLTDLAFDVMLAQHVASGAPLTVATVLTHTKCEFGVLTVDHQQIRGFQEKPSMSYPISTGIYAVSRSAIEGYPSGRAYGFDQLILDLIGKGQYPANYAFDGFWSDIGRPEDYDEANRTWPELLARLLPAPLTAVPDLPLVATVQPVVPTQRGVLEKGSVPA